MELNTIIEVMGYGDFEIENTKAIMGHADKISTDDLLEEFYSIKGINSNEGLNYDMCMLSDITDDFIIFLKKKGFKTIKTKRILFTD